ncbi:DUF4123 domain-containing protein [Pseudomonas sp. FP198]|uniref:DUF4123 domain-containing protein n=1 Tax=Pseudomonas sp. FP198 TaxID=2954084 RepID=UPI0027362F8A|nr:DUF4123 domain-containing protein [Pseudomonas sp. FP198]WLG93452.1 DUF4123 domain-containing protein [Pseudomonas sp. FP198]
MIPYELLTALTNELYGHGASSPRYLVALIDMATLPEETQQKLIENLGDLLAPLFLAPGLEKLRPLGPHLAVSYEATHKGNSALLDRLSPYGSNEIVAWITSTLSPDALVQHLSQATFVDTETGERHLLCYYDSLVTPKLVRHAPKPWRDWLLAPIVSWWYRGATPQYEQWHRVRGQAQPSPAQPSPELVITTELWHALASDPLPHRLLDTLEKTSPGVFSTPCHGVRLALIESLLNKGKSLGLIDHHNLIDFVFLNLQNTSEQLENSANWHVAVQLSAKGKGRLSQLYLQGEKRP